MAITGQFDLRPYGYSAAPEKILHFAIHTTNDNKWHSYTVSWQDATGLQYRHGVIIKTQSGHRNLLHIIADIIEDIGLSSLGTDYMGHEMP